MGDVTKIEYVLDIINDHPYIFRKSKDSHDFEIFYTTDPKDIYKISYVNITSSFISDTNKYNVICNKDTGVVLCTYDFAQFINKLNLYMIKVELYNGEPNCVMTKFTYNDFIDISFDENNVINFITINKEKIIPISHSHISEIFMCLYSIQNEITRIHGQGTP